MQCSIHALKNKRLKIECRTMANSHPQRAPYGGHGRGVVGKAPLYIDCFQISTVSNAFLGL